MSEEDTNAHRLLIGQDKNLWIMATILNLWTKVVDRMSANGDLDIQRFLNTNVRSTNPLLATAVNEIQNCHHDEGKSKKSVHVISSFE
jgi:hypothetical protein